MCEKEVKSLVNDNLKRTEGVRLIYKKRKELRRRKTFITVKVLTDKKKVRQTDTVGGLTLEILLSIRSKQVTS